MPYSDLIPLTYLIIKHIFQTLIPFLLCLYYILHPFQIVSHSDFDFVEDDSKYFYI